MTASVRIKIAILAMLAALVVTVGPAWIGYQVARGDDAIAAVGSGSAVMPTETPANKLHDPVSAPGAAWDDVKAAKKVGWATAVFAVLVLLAKLASRFGKPDSWLGKLGKGKVAVVIGAVGALAAAGYNAAIDGGAWTAMFLAGIVALGHYLDAGNKAPA